MDIKWTNIQYFSVANLSSCHVEFESMQWTQTLWSLTHSACVQSRIWKGYSISWMSEALCSKCIQKHSWPQPINLQPTSWLPTCKWSSPWETGSFSPLHRSAGECRGLNAGYEYHFQNMYVENHYRYIPLHYQLSKFWSFSQMHSQAVLSIQWIFLRLLTFSWWRRPMYI